MEETQIIGLGGQPLKTEATITKEQEALEAEKAEAAAQLLAKQKEVENVYQQQLLEIKAGRIVLTESALDTISRIESLRSIVTMETWLTKRELQNIEIPGTTEKKRMPVPVSSMQVNMMEFMGLREPQMFILERIVELAYTL